MTDNFDIGLDEALAATLEHLYPLPPETVTLDEAVDRVAAEDIRARVDSPSVDASLKDGYAVQSESVDSACPGRQVRLILAGSAAAGILSESRVMPGQTVRVLTGARIPENADAVLSEEFVRIEGDVVLAENSAEKGRNILWKGSDVARGRRVISRGTRLSPGLVGLLAAAGHDHVPVFRNPRVAIIATGDEVVAPGRPLAEGKLYASNLVTLSAWCRRHGWSARCSIVKDEPRELLESLSTAYDGADAIVTSGGAWSGDRDLVAGMLERLGWQEVFHRIRIGPGKAVGFGLLDGRPVFILPGGPPSNLMGFLQIALPGLQRLAGFEKPGLPRAAMRLAEEVNGRHQHWTQFIFGELENSAELPLFHPLHSRSRLQSMAEAQAVAAIPEGITRIAAGTVISAQLLI
ncbi:MAG: molybdopterin molybdotransferase MoeA [Desulfobulbaceae bacterium]|nr:molybdopterin molybdotransferase MoeA [Desulfobulbaceae bacterium]